MAEIETSLLAKLHEAEGTYQQPALSGFLWSRKKYLDIMIKAKTGQALNDLKNEIKKRGGKNLRIYKEINAIYAEVPIPKIRELAAVPGAQTICDAEKNIELCLSESVPVVMGVPKGQLPYRIKGKKLEGQGIKVAVLDSGIDKTHPDFAWRIKRIKNFTQESVSKGTEHGTHVAGIIGGSGKLSGYRLTGVAPRVSFYIAKVLTNSNPSQNVKLYSIFEAMRWAIKQKVHVINMSLGTNWCADGTCPLCEMANYAVSQGITVVVAAGNNGPLQGTINCPGKAKGVITVGAATKTQPFKVAGFSSRGSSHLPGKPDVMAPGIGIRAPQPRGNYGFLQGTSMAAPHVAGFAALLYQARKYLARRKKMTPAEIKQILKQGSKNLGEHPSAQGSGLVNFEQSLKILQPRRKRSWFPVIRKKFRLPAAAEALVPLAASEYQPTTCPASLQMFCPHYDENVCNTRYAACVHYQAATQANVLKNVKEM